MPVFIIQVEFKKNLIQIITSGKSPLTGKCFRIYDSNPETTDTILPFPMDMNCFLSYENSTETALVNVFNDIILDVDRNRTVILLLLDLSAAFDTVDHTILIERLANQIGRAHV